VSDDKTVLADRRGAVPAFDDLDVGSAQADGKTIHENGPVFFRRRGHRGQCQRPCDTRANGWRIMAELLTI
jgi:hypothetical protein